MSALEVFLILKAYERMQVQEVLLNTKSRLLASAAKYGGKAGEALDRFQSELMDAIDDNPQPKVSKGKAILQALLAAGIPCRSA